MTHHVLVLMHIRNSWQSFILGRPPSMADHHFDTQFPSQTPDLLYDPMTCTAALQMFGLADIIGGVTDDAVSLRPVPYSNVRHHDKKLRHWYSNIPLEWNLSDKDITLGLSSDDLATRRITVQAVSILAAYHHIRFTLHRPYASRPPSPVVTPGPQSRNLSRTKTGEDMRHETAESTEIAIANADHVMRLSLLCRCNSTTPPERVFATRGLLAFHSFRLFSVAMFFSFQLIATPSSPHARRFRNNIAQILDALQATPPSIPGGRVAANAAKIMDALAPLWDNDFVHMPPGPNKERFRLQVLAEVRTLAFPYHDMQDSSGSGVSTTLQGVSATLQSIYTANPTVMSQDANSSMAGPSTMQADFHAASFGSRGTLMPDMSVSGRTSIGNPVDLINQFNNFEGTSYMTPGLDSAGADGISWAQSGMIGTVPSGVTFANQSLGSDTTSTQPMLHGVSSSYWTPDNRWQNAGSTVQTQGPHLPPSFVQNAYNPGNPVQSSSMVEGMETDQMHWNLIGPVSSEMPWGASIGIDAGEWAGVMQGMDQDAPEMLSSDIPNAQRHAYGYR
jgi:hypothetical protein